MTHPASVGRDVPLVVLAAGKATRYGGVKPLAPVGIGGEAVIDLLASDALSAGFSTIVLVIGPATGAAIRYHVAHRWPSDIDVRFALQEAPRGTVDAVRAGAAALDPKSHFAVANADDLPSVGALGVLATYLSSESANEAVVTFRLVDSVIGTAPVTRGLCRVSEDGALVGVDERRHVTPTVDGQFLAHDGQLPAELAPDQPVSMNLWAFTPEMVDVFDEAMARAGEGEVVLPEVVHQLLSGGGGKAQAIRIDALRGPGRCIGVTHASDVPLVNAALAREVGRGERPARLWTALDGAPRP